jgi:hypothetical protein
VGKYKILKRPELARVKVSGGHRLDVYEMIIEQQEAFESYKRVEYFLKALNITDYTVASEEREQNYKYFFNNYKHGEH